MSEAKAEFLEEVSGPASVQGRRGGMLERESVVRDS